jgi:anaerobic dimethyl sulfoxide reductase subunit A
MTESQERVITTTCQSHCGGACILKLHVKDGVIVRIETDDGQEPQVRACLKGRAYRQRVYHPDRLLYPMKRVGQRGEDKFARISWDEALETIAGEMKRIKAAHGTEAIIYKYSSGDVDMVHRYGDMSRVFNAFGGCSEPWGFFSYEAGVFAESATYGTHNTFSSRENLLHSKMIIMFGWNPTVTVQETNTSWYMAQARERGAYIVSLDPRYTSSTAAFAGKWIPLIPGTDAALLLAMAHTLMTSDLYDHNFIDRYTLGFDRFREYVLGEADKTPKTSAWAEAITGVPAVTIEELAVDYATRKPAALIAGISPGRTAYGEQYHRLAIVLAAMTGNIGVPGGDAAGRSWTAGYTPNRYMPGLQRGVHPGSNPVEKGRAPRKYALPPYAGMVRAGRFNVSQLADAILMGKAGGYPADYKMLWLHNTGFFTVYLNINKYLEAIKKLDFVVIEEQFMTPGATYADIVLPHNTYMERNDVTIGLANDGYYGSVNKAIESRGESRSPLEVAVALARKLGLEGFDDLTEENCLQDACKGSPHFDGYDALKKAGVIKLHLDKPYVALHEQIENPEHHPFPTPSGKIEIFSQRLEDMEHPLIPAVPSYIETWEGRNDPLAKAYPLQLISSHSNRRAHSQNELVPWLRELEQQAIHMNIADADARGIKDGDMVEVFNGRGRVVIPAKVTERIMPRVVDLPHGAWPKIGKDGVDRGGCPNMLTRDAHSPGGSYVTNTCLVQVKKV